MCLICHHILEPRCYLEKLFKPSTNIVVTISDQTNKWTKNGWMGQWYSLNNNAFTKIIGWWKHKNHHSWWPYWLSFRMNTDKTSRKNKNRNYQALFGSCFNRPGRCLHTSNQRLYGSQLISYRWRCGRCHATALLTIATFETVSDGTCAHCADTQW